MSKIMTSSELAQWCDDNSSGSYRPSAEAASMIRRMEARLRHDLDCTLATIESMMMKSRIVKYDLDRQILIAQKQLEFLVQNGCVIPKGDRAARIEGTVREWAKFCAVTG